jgi:hypothetical protein
MTGVKGEKDAGDVIDSLKGAVFKPLKKAIRLPPPPLTSIRARINLNIDNPSREVNTVSFGIGLGIVARTTAGRICSYVGNDR